MTSDTVVVDCLVETSLPIGVEDSELVNVDPLLPEYCSCKVDSSYDLDGFAE